MVLTNFLLEVTLQGQLQLNCFLEVHFWKNILYYCILLYFTIYLYWTKNLGSDKEKFKAKNTIFNKLKNTVNTFYTGSLHQ